MAVNSVYLINLLQIYVFLAFCILALTVSVSPKKSKKKHKSSHHHHKTVNESTPVDHLSDALRAEHSFKTKQLDINGKLRKSFALEVLLSEGTSSSRSCSPLAALMPLAKLTIGATGKAEKELLNVLGAQTQAKIVVETIKNRITTGMTLRPMSVAMRSLSCGLHPGDGLELHICKDSARSLITEVRGIIRTLKSASGISLNLASKIFVTQNGMLNKNFVQETQKNFQSSAEQINFDDKNKAQFIINKYIKNETDGLTSNPFELQVGSGQKMVILNVVTLLGNWLKKFTKIETGEFHAPSGAIMVPMMTRLSTYNYHKSDVLQAELIEVPYEKKSASFLIVLPYSNVGLGVLLKELKLAPNLLNSAISKMRHTALTLTMPKFKLYDKLDLKPVYKLVGLNKVFEHDTGLTKILDGEELPISSAWQLTYIDVSEGNDDSGGSKKIQDPT